MKCTYCGGELMEGAAFCPSCGKPVVKPAPQPEPAPAFCAGCGAKLKEGAAFCPECGKPVVNAAAQPESQGVMKTIVGKIGNMTGEAGNTEVHFKELFSETFSKHTQEEKDELFTCGATKTTPAERDMISNWPRPWLYIRVFGVLALVTVVLYIMVSALQNPNAVPGLMFIGALAVPFSVVIFLWECNVPRNISIVDCVSMFFVGGVFSLLLTLIIYAIYPNGLADASYIGAIFIASAEEVGKAAIVAYYVRKRNSKYILNGILIGACVGAGFAVFETAGYIYRYGTDLENLMHVLILRGVLAIGGHVVWAAMEGGGMAAAKGDKPFGGQIFSSMRFWTFFFIAVTLHAFWDMPIEFGSKVYLVQIILTVIALAVVLIQISAGLRQVVRVSNEARARAVSEENAEAPAEETVNV